MADETAHNVNRVARSAAAIQLALPKLEPA